MLRLFPTLCGAAVLAGFSVGFFLKPERQSSIAPGRVPLSVQPVGGVKATAAVEPTDLVPPDGVLLGGPRGFSEFVQLMRTSPDEAWKRVFAQKGKLSHKAFERLCREADRADTYCTSMRYTQLICRWTGVDTRIFGIITQPDIGPDTLSKQLSGDPLRHELLLLLAQANPMHDWVRSADFLQANARGDSERAELMNRAVEKWVRDEGAEAAAVWLENGAHGTEYDWSRRYLAERLFAKNQSLALKLIAAITDNSQRQAAIIRISSQSGSVASLGPLMQYADESTCAFVQANAN